MKRKGLFQTLWGLSILLFSVGCITPTPILTLTINENECSFAGPNTISMGEFIIKLTMNENKPTESGYALVTLEDGKTIEDLKVWPSADQPPWVILIDGVHEFTAGTHTYSYDQAVFSQNALYKGGPLYLGCFRADPDTGIVKKIAAFGPIELK